MTSERETLTASRSYAIERLRSLAFGVINPVAEGAMSKPNKRIECSWQALASWAKEIGECCDLLVEGQPDPDYEPYVVSDERLAEIRAMFNDRDEQDQWRIEVNPGVTPDMLAGAVYDLLGERDDRV